MNIRKQARYAVLTLLCVIVMGVCGYRLLLGDEFDFLNALYMTIITLFSVGFGEYPDLSRHPGARVFTMMLILVGISILTFVISSVTAIIVEGHIQIYFRRRKAMNAVKGLQDHLIVCGAGRSGIHVIEELAMRKKSFVVIEA